MTKSKQPSNQKLTTSNKTLFALGALLIVVISVNLFFKSAKKQTLAFNNTSYSYELFNSKEQRQLGLSGRKSLDDGHVAIFLFDYADKHGIWMKDMNFDIDILWLDESGKVVGIKDNASPNSYPEVFYPEEKALYVIEGSSSLIEGAGIEMGRVVNLPQNITD